MSRKDLKEYKLSLPDSPLSPRAVVSGLEDRPICSETYGRFQESILQWIDTQETPEWFSSDYKENIEAIKHITRRKEPKQAKELRKEKSEAVKSRRMLFNKSRDQLMLAMLHAGRAYICTHPSCGEMRHLHVDHIIPLSKGGTDELSNLQFLCSKHNAEKGAKYPNS